VAPFSFQVGRSPGHLDSVQAARQRLVEQEHREESAKLQSSRFSRPRRGKETTPREMASGGPEADSVAEDEAARREQEEQDARDTAEAQQQEDDEEDDPLVLAHKMPLEASRGKGFDKSKLFEPPIMPFHFTDHILSVKIHKTEALRPSMYVQHPVIQVHFINEGTGEYLVKQPIGRPVTGLHENCTWNDRPKAYNYILPAMTKPFSLRGKEYAFVFECSTLRSPFLS